MFEKWLVRISRHPRVIIASVVLLSAAFLLTVKRNARMETDLDEYMPADHPAFVYSEQAEEWFNIKDGIIFAVESPSGIYNQGTLQKIRDLTTELQNLPEIDGSEVTSLYTADNIVANEDGLDVEPFYVDTLFQNAVLDTLRTSVENNEMIHRRMVSEDGTVALVVAPIGDDVFSQSFYSKIQEIAQKYEGPEQVHVAGRPIVEGTMARLAPLDMRKMVPVVVLVIIMVLLLVLRNFSASVATLMVVVLSTVWTFGLMALLDIPVYAVSTMIPVMLIAIGVADGIHLYNHLRLHLSSHPTASRQEAVAAMLQGMWKPVVMTSVTTAVGFVSLLTSSVYPIKYFGLFTAFGVISAMVLSLLFIPAMILLTGVPKPRHPLGGPYKTRGERFAAKYAQLMVRWKYPMLVLTVLLVAGSVLGISRLWINSSFLDKFERDSDIVRTDAFINEHFGGTSTLNIVLESQNPDAFKKPDVLHLVDGLQTKAEGLDRVGSSFSITDYVKRMNKVMHADNPAYEVIPESRELIAQYILLYEMSGDPENLWKLVDYDYRKANVTLQLKGDDSKTINQAIAAVEQFRSGFSDHGITMHFAGSGYKSLVFSNLILFGQVTSLALSLVIVTVLIGLMFRSIRLGLIGSVPIVLTGLISFGIMGGANIALSTTTALLSSIAIGIGIDYAIHFLDRFRHYRTQTDDMDKVSSLTMNSTGRAILFNAVVVVSGFMVLLLSVFPPNRILGALVSLNMTLTFVATVTVMYVLLRSQSSRIWPGSVK